MPRVDDLALERARATTTVDVLAALGHAARGSGVWRAACCPFDDHRDRNASFSVNVQHGGWNCHGCGRSGGDAIELLMQVRPCRFEDAVSELSGMGSAAPLPNRRPATAAPRPSAYVSTSHPSRVELAARALDELRDQGYVPCLPASVYRCVLQHTKLEPHGAAYLASRGFDPGFAEQAGCRSIANANQWSTLYETLGRNFLPDEIAAAGLSKPPFGDSIPVIMLAYLTSGGEVDTLRLRRSDAGGPKRYHSLEGNGPRVPFGLESVGQIGGQHIYLVEGELNALAIRQCGQQALGFPGVNGWKDEWSPLLCGVKRACVVLDDDDAGQKAAPKIARSLAQAHGRAWVDAHLDVQLWGTDAADLYAQGGLVDALR
jgi:DNA primase